MDVDCEGCAGCCVDWRAIAPPAVDTDHERRGSYEPVDDVYNLVPLTAEEVRGFVDDGLGDALAPRLFGAETGVDIDGVTLAAVEGQPVFLVGLRTVPKPVAPFDQPATWLPTCVFLDPSTLQCRIHGDDRYPEECATYPGRNLALEVESECERVERAHGGERLLDDEPAGSPPRLDASALGTKVFVHPDPADLDGRVGRLIASASSPSDRAAFVAAAAAARPGTTAVDEDAYGAYHERVLAADSWVGRAVADWTARADAAGADDANPTVASTVEDDRGAPSTPGWE